MRMRMCCARTRLPILRAKAMRALIEGIIERLASAAAAFVGATGVRAGCAASVFLEVLAAVACRERMLAADRCQNRLPRGVTLRGAAFTRGTGGKSGVCQYTPRLQQTSRCLNLAALPEGRYFFIISTADRAGKDACAGVPPHTRMRHLGGDALARLLSFCCLKYQ